MTKFTDALHDAFMSGRRIFPDFGMYIDTDNETFYSQLYTLITSQEELDDAYIKAIRLYQFLNRELYGVNDIEVDYDSMPKTYESYSKKICMEPHHNKYFNIVSDISKISILTENVAGNMDVIIAKLQEYITQFGGAFTICPTGENQPDLFQYVYVYKPGNYVSVVQIIHPLAAKIYEADSECRTAVDFSMLANGLK